MIRGIATAVLVDRVRRTAVANMSNYEQEHASFRLAIPEFFNFGFDVVDRWAEDPAKLAMLWVDDAGHSARYTFADIRRESNRFASVLQGLGVRQGDGVMLVLPRLPQWHSIIVALMKLGAIPIPGTVLLTPKDFEYRMNMAEASVVIVGEANAAKVEAVRANCPTLQHCIIVGHARPGWVEYNAAMATASETFIPVATRSTAPAIIYFTSG